MREETHERTLLEAAQRRIRQLEQQLEAAQEQILLLAGLGTIDTQSGHSSTQPAARPVEAAKP